MSQTSRPSPSRSTRRAVAALAVVAVALAAAAIAWRAHAHASRGAALPEFPASPPPSAASAASAPVSETEPAAQERAGAPVKAKQLPPDKPVAWNGDYRRFFPLAPGNTWKYVGVNTRAHESFEYIWHIVQRTGRPTGETIYAVDLYRNGQYHDRFFFGADTTGLYRFGTPDSPPGIVIRYPAVVGTSWPLGAGQVSIVGKADVATPAGRFPDAVIVAVQETGKPGDTVWSSDREYFVPGVGRVKAETLSHHDGKTDTLKAELAGYEVSSD